MKGNKKELEVKMTTNMLECRFDYERFREAFAVFRFRMRSDNRWLSAYNAVLALPQGLCLSVTTFKSTDGQDGVWYYLLVPAQRAAELRRLMTGADDNPVELYEFTWVKSRVTDVVLLNLLLNTCTLEDDEIVSRCDYGKLLLIGQQSGFMGIKNNETGAVRDLVALELKINEDAVFQVSTVTFKPVHPDEKKGYRVDDEDEEEEGEEKPGAEEGNVNKPQGKDEKGEKKKPRYDQFYSFDHTRMTIIRELPPDWKERYMAGTMTFYVRGTSRKNRKNVIKQLDLNPDELHVGKVSVMHQILRCLKSNYSEWIIDLSFCGRNCRKVATDYELRAVRIMKSVAPQGLRCIIEDTVQTDESRALAETVRKAAGEIKPEGWGDGLFLSFTAEDGVDCILRLVRPEKDIKKGEEDVYMRTGRSMKAEAGIVVQHMEIKKEYNNDKTMKVALARIMKELVVKRIIADRYIKQKDLLGCMVGWNFEMCKKVEDERQLGLAMHVAADGLISFARFGHAEDAPPQAGRQELNRLHLIHEKFQDRFGMDRYPSQDIYCMMSRNGNFYHIVYSQEQALPDFKAMKDFYRLVNERKWGVEDLIGMMPPVENAELLKEEIEKVDSRNADKMRLFSSHIREKAPEFSRRIMEEVKDAPYADLMRRADNRDIYFGGMVDIHYWAGAEGQLKYVAAEYGNALNKVTGLSWNGLPHVRTVVPVNIARPEAVMTDYMDIISMLQWGFGKKRSGTTLPFGFKLLGEMCEMLCLEQFGIHWKAMNAKQFKEWNGRFYDGKTVLLGG